MKVQKNRRSQKRDLLFIMIIFAIIIFIISVVFLIMYVNKEEVTYITSKETKDVEYEVLLKENNYYKDRNLPKSKEYISNLVDSINTNFKYDLKLSEALNKDYTCKYKIVADISVKSDKSKKEIYLISEDITEEKVINENQKIHIDEKVNIDFKRYNDLISEFRNIYGLKEAVSNIELNLLIEIQDQNSILKNGEFKVLGLNIPLAEKTFEITLNEEVTDELSKVQIIKNVPQEKNIYLVFSIIGFILDIIFIIKLIIYRKNNITNNEKYEKELKKIINSYGSFVSKIDNEFDMRSYQLLKVNNFIDLIEIRDTMHIPIIMIKNEEAKNTTFIIPTPDKILYFYSLGVKQYAFPFEKHYESSN